MSKKAISYIYLALCVLLWASIPVVSKKILVELNNIQMLFYSTVLSFVVMCIVLVFQKKVKTLKDYSRKDYLAMFFLGFLGAYLYYVLLYGAFALTTAQEGMILTYTWPILVLILAFIILKERVTVRKILAILISFFGIVVIVTYGKILSFTITNLQGDVLALIGASVWALFSIACKKFKFDHYISTFIYFFSGMIFITITVSLFSGIKLPSINIWPWLLFNGTLVNGISYVFWFKALEGGDTHIISNALYLTPVFSLFYISIFLSEKILLSSIIGLVIIISGILLQSINVKKIT